VVFLNQTHLHGSPAQGRSQLLSCQCSVQIVNVNRWPVIMVQALCLQGYRLVQKTRIKKGAQ
jgi:hypothetical protein